MTTQNFLVERRQTCGEMHKLVQEIHGALLGDFKDEGLVAKTRRHEKFVRGWEKLKWIAISALVVALIGGMFSFFNGVTNIQSRHRTAQTTDAKDTHEYNR